jgi:biopolymer transport protein ExbD
MNRENNEAAPVINITPLIDILLVLLIIFMVISPLRAARFEAKVPAEANRPVIVNPHPHSLIVTIDKDLKLKLNKQGEMGSVDDTGKLTAELISLFQQRKQNGILNKDVAHRSDLSEDEKVLKTVFIKAPRSVQYGTVVKVMDAIKGAGAEPVGLLIDDLER